MSDEFYKCKHCNSEDIEEVVLYTMPNGMSTYDVEEIREYGYNIDECELESFCSECGEHYDTYMYACYDPADRM